MANNPPYLCLHISFRVALCLYWPLKDRYLVGKDHSIAPASPGSGYSFIEPQQLSHAGNLSLSNLKLRRPVLHHDINVLQSEPKLRRQIINGLPHKNIKPLAIHAHKYQWPLRQPASDINLARKSDLTQTGGDGSLR